MLVVALGAGLTYSWLSRTVIPEGAVAEYVGGQRCVACHSKEHAAWLGSHHDRAMELMSPQTTRGDFNNATFTDSQGRESHFFTEDGHYLVETPGRGGKQERFELTHTFGVEPLQQYLAEFPGGRKQALPIAWDTGKKRWFHLYDAEKLQPDEWLYWTNWGMNWNHQCAECHSTNLKKNYNAAADTYHTTWTDMSVNCEACHGPGSHHVAIHTGGGWFTDKSQGTGLAPLKSKDTNVVIDTCGKCHSRRQVGHPGFKPGDNLLDAYDPELLDTPAYHADGQILDEDYEYGSFHLSLMYHKGIRCVDCHDPHTAKPRATGNQLCIRCHQAGKYDAPSHHFHEPGGTGAQCVNCHMPTTTYMTVHPRHDHSFRVPRPELTKALGMPNACNRCHGDKTVDWSLQATRKWYGEKKWPARLDFAAAIAGGREVKSEAAAPLAKFARDSSVPATVRASAISLLRRYPGGAPFDAAKEGLSDDDAIVRLMAVRWFEGRRATTPGSTPIGLGAVAERLADPVRLVRAEAARVLAPSRGLLTGDQLRQFDSAQREYLEGMEDRRDAPDGNYNLGNFYADLGDPERAAAFYRAALKQEPAFHAARFNLAMIEYQLGRLDESKQEFERLITAAERSTRLPDQAVVAWNVSMLAQAHYHLGLLMAESPDSLPEATRRLEKAVALDPTLDRARYNLGLARQHQGELREALAALSEAYKARPGEADYAYALALLLAQQKQFEPAKKIVRRAISDHPTDPRFPELERQLANPR